MDSDNWEDTFFTELAQSESPAPNSPVEEDEEDLDIERTPICKSYSEAIKWLDDIKLFLETKGQCEEASAIGLAAESVAAVHLRSERQTSIWTIVP